MTQLDQEIPKIKGSTILSTLDVASGFWTIPVHPDDQHKLAFTFGNRQYTFTRCPFGYANSPAEFNIFLNKACLEIDHVLNQLTTAGAKIAPHKGQWCKTKVNYVTLRQDMPKTKNPHLETACGLPKLFNGHAAHLSRTERTATTANDKSQVL